MQISDIRDKWVLLSKEKGQQIRVSVDSLPELFLGIDSEGKRGLILWLSDDKILDYRSCHKEKISIEYFPNKNAILLRLNDNNFFDLFDDLILSVINHISNVSDNSEYPKELFTTFYKWSNFFDDCPNEMIKPNIIMGIWGELFILHKLLLEIDSVTLLNDILSSWKGPYRKGHDFETNLTDIEVKTKDITKQTVKISSEYQLEKQHNKPLELSILSVKSDINKGLSINNLYENIKFLIQKRNGDMSIFLRALCELNLVPSNINKYEDIRLTAIELISYDCCKYDFPSIVTSNLKRGQFNIQYDLLVTELQEFIITREQFSGESV